MEINEWLAKVSGQDLESLSLNQVATRANISHVTLGRRVKAGDLPADLVIMIARAYRADIVRSLVDLGFITEAEIRHPHVLASIREASDEEIVAEVTRRIKEGRDTPAFDEPVNLSVAPDSVDEWTLSANRDVEESEQ